MSADLSFPPLLKGVAVGGSVDPFDKARALAMLGCDGGTVVHNVQADMLRAAIVFAPEVALSDALAMLPVCGVGFQNALGALAPPEVAVHLDWSGAIRVNAARCGRLRVSASTSDAGAVPDWLVVGMEVTIMQAARGPDDDPEVTALMEEGCAEVDPGDLVEAWARHTLVWINRWTDEGNPPVHSEWMGLAHGIGEPVEIAGHRGRFLGVDERFGMLIRDGDTTHLLPITHLLEDAS